VAIPKRISAIWLRGLVTRFKRT